MKIGVTSAEPANTVLAHQHRGVEVMRCVPTEVRQLCQRLRQDSRVTARRGVGRHLIMSPLLAA